ncbi:hypothetical protein L3556_02200 [Candidatus Synechococcus calcipolaris G9]|uniref:Polymerase beta nucleotidyltransferase domain-containing protein n=1 Tax=Candidatus Synechococcus calcipolaris G9 TaxID=1497997 RepID=A0ABT6EWL5_9SYNE|nr:hypothetical protein [Candidatus Synechococcus calcipolaris]MDG2989752.1 hypothetical protein [Candidatus Synechococcus calcipolaris G9]
MDTFDYQASRHFLEQKYLTLRAKRHALWQQAYSDCQSIITMMIENYHPKRIIQWGSVLYPKHFSEVSDIDLAVEGLETQIFMKLFSQAEDMTSFSLDLIQWEYIHPSFQEIILMKGTIVYGE